MIDFLMSTAFMNECYHNVSFLNQNGWLNITVLVVLASLSIGAVGYSIAPILPGNYREKLKAVVRYEYIQGIFSIMLIAILFTMSLGACDMAGALTVSATGAAGYRDPFQFAQYYVGNLLFSKGLAIMTGLVSAGTVLAIDAAMANYLASAIGNILPNSVPLNKEILGNGGTYKLSFNPSTVDITGTDQPATIIYEYGYVFNLLLGPLVVITFGLLFLTFLSLPAIEMLALTLVVPIAIIMRSLAFTGPRLREVSNTLLALAIAMYFVLPLTFAMNYYVVNWMYCGTGGTCNPYYQYLQGYRLNTQPINELFANSSFGQYGSSSLGTLTLPYNFYAYDIVSGNGGVASLAADVINGLKDTPLFINQYAIEVAQYLFQGIFLIGLDVGITVGFAMGLSKGLESMGRMFGVGPFWSG